MTLSELDALQGSKLHRRTPYAISGVSHSQFSVARHYGGCTYMGESYVYSALDDELIRADVAQWLTKWRMRLAKGSRPSDAERQGVLL